MMKACRIYAATVAALCLVPAARIDAADTAEEAAVFVATIRQQVEEQLDAAERARGAILCVGIDPGSAPQSPNRELMARLGNVKFLRRLTECDPRPKGAVESSTLRPAIIVTAGPIEWKAVDEAWVTVRYFRTRSRSAVRVYRVVREREGWVSLGPILLDGPAQQR
jgi:hypothetical protein